jgi:hypothetical protein
MLPEKPLVEPQRAVVTVIRESKILRVIAKSPSGYPPGCIVRAGNIKIEALVELTSEFSSNNH